MTTEFSGTSGALQVGANTVGATQIVDGSITGTKLASATVTPSNLSQSLTLGTAQATTSGTAIDFTGVPSWVKRITVMLSGVSTNGTNNYIVQIGAGSVVSSGYSSSATVFISAGAISIVNYTNGFHVYNAGSAADSASGHVTLTLLGGNTWVCSANIISTGARGSTGTGQLTLGGTLDRLRFTTNVSVDTFDAGSVNIMYE